MAEIESELTMYDINKGIMSQKEPMEETQLTHGLSEVVAWMSFVKDSNFMLLCHEVRDYTIFHFETQSKKCYEASQALKEVLCNRGIILDIAYDKEQHSYGIWIFNENDNEAFLYFLFPYDLGVINI